MSSCSQNEDVFFLALVVPLLDGSFRCSAWVSVGENPQDRETSPRVSMGALTPPCGG